MEKEINVQVVSIEEEHFSIQYDKLPSSKDDIETIIGYSWIIHPEQSNVAISMWIRIQKRRYRNRQGGYCLFTVFL